jgi:hypothetical protein
MKLSLTLILFFLYACDVSIAHVPKPQNLISKSKMVTILIDLSVSESYIQNEYHSVLLFHKLLKNCGDEILQKNQVSFEQYSTSLDYYSSQVEPLQEIYTIALDSINLRVEKLK